MHPTRHLLIFLLALSAALVPLAGMHGISPARVLAADRPPEGARHANATTCSDEALVHKGETVQITASVIASDPSDPGEGESFSLTVTFHGQTLITISSFGTTQTVTLTASADDFVVSCLSGEGNDGDESANVQVVGSPVPPKSTDGNCNPGAEGTSDSQGSCGDPIDTYTGNFSRTFTDFDIPARGFPLHFAHIYNSMDHATDGPLGYGWTFDPSMSLQQDSSGNVTITQENGSQVSFSLASGIYTPAPWVQGTLVKNADGTFTFVRRGRETFTFSAAGQLESETDRNGYTTTFGYNTGGQLVTITDASSRSLTLAWSNGHINSVTDPIGRTVCFYYASSGDLSDVVDPAGVTGSTCPTTPGTGHTTHFTYDANHLLLTITDPRGTVLQNTYDTSGRVTAQTIDPSTSTYTGLNRTTTVTYNGDPNGIETTDVKDPHGMVTEDTYAAGLRTMRIIGQGASGQQLVWLYGYDLASHLPISVSAPGMRTTAYTWDANGNPLSVTDPMGRTTSYSWNAYDELTGETDPMGEITTITRDGHGNVTSISLPLAGTSSVQQTMYHHDDAAHPGDLTSVTDPDNHTWTFTYDAWGDRASMTDPLGNKTTYSYTNAAMPTSVGLMTARTSPRGNVSGASPSSFTTRYDYDALGDLTTITDPLGNKTVRQYDGDRNLVSLTQPCGTVTSAAAYCNSADTPSTVVANHTWTYTYNTANQLTQITRPDGTTLQWNYNPDGTLASRIDPSGNPSTFTYDALGRISYESIPSVGNITAFYDSDGRVAGGYLPGGAMVNYTYDADDEVTAVGYVTSKVFGVPIANGWSLIDPGIEGYAYSLSALASSINSALNNGATGVQDVKALATYANGRFNLYVPGFSADVPLTATQGVYVLSSTAGTWEQGAYSAPQLGTIALGAGWNLVAAPQVQGGLDTALVTHDANRTGCNVQEIATYDSSGYHVYTPGHSSTFTIPVTSGLWILCGAPAQWFPTSSDPTIASITYDGDGRRASMIDGTGQSTWTYDSLGRLTSSTDGNGANVGYSYDLADNVTGITSPGGHAVGRTYDPAGRLQTVSDWLGHTTSFGYSPDGALSTETFPSTTGIVDSFGYDNAGNLASISDTKGSTPFATFSYGRNADGLITSLATTGLSQPTQSYAYDLLDQLSGVNGSTYTVDPTGDVTGMPNGTTLQYNTTDDQLQSSTAGSNTTTYSFDSAGRRIGETLPSSTSVTYSYDAANRLAGYNNVQYTYNADDLRMSKIANGVVTPYVWDVADARPQMLQDGSTSYVYGPSGLPLEQISASGSVLYYHQDALGSTRLLTDNTGAVKDTYTYDAFGALTASTGTDTNPFGYDGQYTDLESGLIYLEHRMYDPTTASFLTVDPRINTTLTPYAYAHDDPINRVDPTGLSDAKSSGPSSGGGSSDDNGPVSGQIKPITAEIDLNMPGPLSPQLSVQANKTRSMVPNPDPTDTGWQANKDLNLQLQVTACPGLQGYVQVTPDGKQINIGVQLGDDSSPIQGQVQTQEGNWKNFQAEIDVKAGSINGGVQVSPTGVIVSVGGKF